MKRSARSSNTHDNLPSNGVTRFGIVAPDTPESHDCQAPQGLAPPDARRSGAADAEVQVALDLRRIAEMPEVPIILEICRKASGMPFVAIARAPDGPGDGRWIACAAHDALGLGVNPGDELQIASVLHHRAQHDQSLFMVGGACDPRRIGLLPDDDFGSHVAVPIIRVNGTAFGMLCAVDPIHRFAKSGMRELFEHLAKLVAVGLDVRTKLDDDRAALTAERDTAHLAPDGTPRVGSSGRQGHRKFKPQRPEE